jgi:FtsH-binding integral membrane protein
MKKIHAFLQELMKDKNGSYSLRELVIAILLLALIVSWIGQQFFGKQVPDSMFYTFASLIAAGTFGYSFERKMTDNGPCTKPPQQ